MTREELIHMAREASASMLHGGEYALFGNTAIERFAALARADEREACAKVADHYSMHDQDTPADIAEAIRARGKA